MLVGTFEILVNSLQIDDFDIFINNSLNFVNHLSELQWPFKVLLNLGFVNWSSNNIFVTEKMVCVLCFADI